MKASPFEEMVIHKNEKRKLIKSLDRRNNRFRYIKEYPDGTREACSSETSMLAGNFNWYPVDRELCVKVRWLGRQSAEDLYQNVDQPDRVYIRVQAPDKGKVCWYSSIKHPGGYEADCSLRRGLVIHVINKGGQVLFTEQMVSELDSCKITANKNGPFSYEEEKRLADEIQRYFRLSSYDKWRNWLLTMKQQCHNEQLNDTWIHCTSELLEEPEKIKGYSYLGRSCILLHEKRRHKIVGCEWEAYTLYSEDKMETIALCGYRWKKI